MAQTDFEVQIVRTARDGGVESPLLRALRSELGGERLVGLSRGQLDGPAKVESLAFPGSLLRALRPELGRREGS